MTALGFLVVSLAAARLTRIITTDTIGQPLRDWAERTHPLVDELVSCPWCLGWWISLACVTLWWTTNARAVWLLAPFAVSYVVGFLANRED